MGEMSQNSQPPRDRRVRRSRRELQRALVELTLEKGYDSVTVDDIANRADVARGTFYAHYVDKDGLLHAVVTDLIDELMTVVEQAGGVIGPPVTEGQKIIAMFRHGELHRDIYRVVLSGAGSGLGLRMLSDAITEKADEYFTAACRGAALQPVVAPVIVARSFTGQHLTMLRWWLDNPGRYSIEEIAYACLCITVGGHFGTLGFAPGSVSVPSRQEFERLHPQQVEATG
jgi:AcrR family transcriptional regulator